MNPKFPKLLGKLCLGTMILYGVQAHSQTMNDDIHASFAGFDSSQLSTPFLLDRSLNVMNLEDADVEIDSTPYTTYDWLQSYMDLRSSQYSAAGALPLSPKTLLQFIDEYRKNDLHPIGLLAKNINLIPEAYFDETRIIYDSVNATFDFSNYDYTLDEKLVVTAAQLVPVVEGNLFNLILEEDFVFRDIAIDSFFISIPAIGLVKNISMNTVYPIDISEINNELGEFTVYLHFYVGGTVFQRGMYFKHHHHHSSQIPEEPDEIVSDFSFPNSCSFNAPKGYGEARVFVLFSNPINRQNHTITKPLILVEGYDPSSMDFGAIKWKTYSTGHSYNELGEEVYHQLQMMPVLLEKLLNLGYDILIVDFKKSSNNLETNAATLAKIIQYTKYRTVGNVDVTLMGASMGGILSQVAMNLLDKSNCKTCVGTFVSFDAPYHGANIPMGIQESAKYFYKSLAKAELQYEFKLDVPAAKELLYEHVNQNTERQAWLSTFSQMNKKLATFNVSLASSSNESIMNGINNGDELIFFKVKAKAGKKTYTDFHVYSAYRSDHLVISAKFPRSYFSRIPRYFASHKAYYFPSSYNYDGLPGSISNFIGEMYDELEKEAAGIKFKNLFDIDGPGMPKGRNHSFVPTISAIDYSTSNPLANLINFDWEMPHTSRPFDMVFFASQNDFHVLISQEQINHLESILTKKIGDFTDISVLPFNNFNVFNFGKTNYSSFGTVTIHNGGQLTFNNSILVNYGMTGVDPLATKEKIFARTSSCDAHVTCEANGSIILGGTNPNGFMQTAEVEFRKGSILELQSDAVLRIRDGSTLIIDEGALMIIHPGAQIILEGENAVLEIRGVVRLEDGAVFRFNKGVAAKGGFVRFNFKDNSIAHFDVRGPNCKIDLSGDANTPDKIVEIVGTTSLAFDNAVGPNLFVLSEFKLRDGLIEYTGQGKIDLKCPVNIKNVDFEQTVSQAGTALVTHGQPSLLLEDCVFKHFGMGLLAYNNHMGSDLLIKNNIFYMCGTGLESHGRKLTLDKNGFHTCGFGVVIEGTTDVVMQGTDLIYNYIGLETNGSNPHVRLNSCWFANNEYGIYDVYETKFTLSCSPFEYNNVAMETNGKVNMSPNYMFPGQSAGGENNSFYYNTTAIRLHFAEIHLKNGQNNFIAGSSGQLPNFLMGILVSSPIYIPTNILDVSGNYFDNIPSGGISAGQGTMYSLQAYSGSGPTGTPVTLNGLLLSNFNQTCFSMARIFPDFKSEVIVDAPEYHHGESNRLADLKVYPNPTSDLITLEGKTESGSKQLVIVFDLNGKEIHRRDWMLVPGLNRTQFSLRELAEPGVYLIKIVDESGDYQVVRISLTY